MQLDSNRIVIRERGLLDLLDLALFVIRTFAGPLIGALALGIVPAMLLNAWILADLAEPGFDEPIPMAYMWWMLMLVVWETPLVTSFATLYLGEAAFQERPHMGSVFRSAIHALPQLIVFQVLLRGLLMPLVVTWFFPFAVWPYLNEVILLERNPLRKQPGRITTYRRTRALHFGAAGDLFARWMVAAGFGSLLAVSLWISMQITVGMLLNEWQWEGLTYTLYYPLALWIVVGYFTVVRFLGYLDLRIRREGWEVELMMRAEGARLSRQLA